MTAKTPCAVCLEKGTSYPMTEAEMRIHLDANPDHKQTANDPVVTAPMSVPKFFEWKKAPGSEECRPLYWFKGTLVDAHELLHMGEKVPDTPSCAN